MQQSLATVRLALTKQNKLYNDKNTNWPVLKTMLIILNSYIKPVSLSLWFKTSKTLQVTQVFIINIHEILVNTRLKSQSTKLIYLV